jgi:hypothetical protein
VVIHYDLVNKGDIQFLVNNKSQTDYLDGFFQPMYLNLTLFILSLQNQYNLPALLLTLDSEGVNGMVAVHSSGCSYP